MFHRLLFTFLAGFTMASIMPHDAQAQLGSPSGFRSIQQRVLNRPTVSPYLSLLSRDNQQAGLPTYFTRVRPQLEAQRRAQEQDRQNDQLQRLQRQVSQTRRQITQAQRNQGVFPTGHPTRFSNHSHYYPTLSRR